MFSPKLSHFSLRQLIQQQNSFQILPAKRRKSSASGYKMRPFTHHFASIVAVEQDSKSSHSSQI